MNSLNAETMEKYDFARHEQIAVSDYLREFNFYADLAAAAKRIAEEALSRRNIRPHSIEARAKDPASFGRKAAKPSKLDPSRPMYSQPLEQITDKAAIRLITFFPRTIQEIDQMLREEFSILEHLDKGESLVEEERFGYQSVHYLVKINSIRTTLPEYKRFEGKVVEVQVRTILQHTWAEIEHDIQYKSSSTIPRDIKRRFMSLAGLLEIADREFQAIQDADRDLTERAETQILSGDFSAVEITSNSLKAYLDKTIGSDGRMSDFSYDWTARLLLRLGFTSLDQVNEAIKQYDDDNLSRMVEGTRQGQLSRFECVLLAALGEKFIQRHPWSSNDWFITSRKRWLGLFQANSIPIGGFDPIPEQPAVSEESEVECVNRP